MSLLEQHFDVAFAAPDGIKKLRELILTLAMQGKLVPQDPNDEPASELLRSIELEKQRLVKEGKIKKSKPLPKIQSEEVPYDLPNGWEWTRLNDALDVRDGTHDTPKYVDVGYPLITSKNLYTGMLSFEDVKFISEEDHIKISERSKVNIGDILFAMIGSIGNPVIVNCNEEFSIKNVALLKFYIADKPDNRYLHYFLAQAQENMKAQSSGAVQSFVSLGFLRNYLLPLPPLAEQRRIVAKIDQLMARCDELEKLRIDRSQRLLTVHTAALDRLLTAKDSSEFSTAWSFITQQFGELYSVKENVVELRKTILQLAVMGKLVPQDPNDEPASELLRSIELEKQRLVKEGKIKQSKPLPEIDREEIPYELPNGWELVRFGELATEIATGPFGLTIHKSDYVENGIPLINPIHMINGEIVHDPTVTVTNEKASQMESYRLFDGDIVMARRGEMGRCAIVTNHSNRWLCGTGSFVLRFIPNINRSYIIILFKSQGVKDYLGGNSVGTTMTNLNHGILNKMPIMLPSIAEQRRIVEKIDRLMGMCDRLEESIKAGKGKQTDLLNALMSQV
ncbi:restriction endonuclease subunit S [Chamaesiphon minutus]|uniref:Restriction endonuclease S subunit n=1 Tax=Chamaesiphon minutus (strain ATCC 27169 / PCC 6605) TaxID=1173020 RepID=K9ULR0_CHAP6|nr:restriction endonuclease subunit S [Chamaesiphon minutus]AFY95139.1 restriction endonuclease S subunit [Chamaesiphon minutus PCC 6605]